MPEDNEETATATRQDTNEVIEINRELVMDALHDVYDPEIPVNIVDLGLVYDLQIAGSRVDITMTLTAIGCPAAPEVLGDVETKVRMVPGVEECHVELTFDPPWSTERMSEDAKWDLGIM